MFKHYLTYQFSLSFERACQGAALEGHAKTELIRLSHQLVQHVSRAVHSKDAKEQGKSWFVALHYLKDCEEMLRAAPGGIAGEPAIEGRKAVLMARLSELCTQAVGSEQGQLRLFA